MALNWRMIGNALRWAVSVGGEAVKEEFTGSDGKGLRDETTVRLAVSDALKKGLMTLAEKKVFEERMRQAGRRGGEVAQNICRIVEELWAEKCPTKKETITTTSGKKKEAKVVEIPVPSWKSPASEFVAELAKTRNNNDFFRIVEAYQLFQLNPDGTVIGGARVALDWLKRQNDAHDLMGQVDAARQRIADKADAAKEAVFKGGQAVVNGAETVGKATVEVAEETAKQTGKSLRNLLIRIAAFFGVVVLAAGGCIIYLALAV